MGGVGHSLQLVTVAVKRILLNACVSSWQEGLEWAGMEVHVPGVSLCPSQVLCRMFDFCFPPPPEAPTCEGVHRV